MALTEGGAGFAHGAQLMQQVVAEFGSDLAALGNAAYETTIGTLSGLIDPREIGDILDFRLRTQRQISDELTLTSEVS